MKTMHHWTDSPRVLRHPVFLQRPLSGGSSLRRQRLALFYSSLPRRVVMHYFDTDGGLVHWYVLDLHPTFSYR